jgi:hypothetical protein
VGVVAVDGGLAVVAVEEAVLVACFKQHLFLLLLVLL